MIFISINVEVKLESIAFEEKNQMLITIIYIYIYTYQILEYLRFYKRSYKNVVKLIRKEPND